MPSSVRRLRACGSPSRNQSGAVVPGALVQIKGAEDKTAAVSMSDLASDRQGIVTAADLMPGRYTVQVAFSGFETLVIPDVRVRAGENRRDAVLAIQKLDESVSVGRDKATVASDPSAAPRRAGISADV